MNQFTLAKVQYEYTIHGKSAIVVREDGAWAKVHDKENDIDDWEDELMNMVANDVLSFREG